MTENSENLTSQRRWFPDRTTTNVPKDIYKAAGHNARSALLAQYKDFLTAARQLTDPKQISQLMSAKERNIDRNIRRLYYNTYMHGTIRIKAGLELDTICSMMDGLRSQRWIIENLRDGKDFPDKEKTIDQMCDAIDEIERQLDEVKDEAIKRTNQRPGLAAAASKPTIPSTAATMPTTTQVSVAAKLPATSDLPLPTTLETGYSIPPRSLVMTPETSSLIVQNKTSTPLSLPTPTTAPPPTDWEMIVIGNEAIDDDGWTLVD